MGKNSKNFPYFTILEDDMLLAGYIDNMWIERPEQRIGNPRYGKLFIGPYNTNKFSPSYKAYLDRIVGKGNWMYRPHGKQRLCFRHEKGLARFLLEYHR